MLGLTQTVLVHDDMETMHLRGESFRDLNREGSDDCGSNARST